MVSKAALKTSTLARLGPSLGPGVLGQSTPLTCLPAVLSPAGGARLTHVRQRLQTVSQNQAKPHRWQGQPGSPSFLELQRSGGRSQAVAGLGPPFPC